LSSWHYQIMRHTADSGEDYLGVHEFYTMHDGKLGWTAKPILIEADTLPEMRTRADGYPAGSGEARGPRCEDRGGR
jgi:hypothetical protein